MSIGQATEEEIGTIVRSCNTAAAELDICATRLRTCSRAIRESCSEGGRRGRSDSQLLLLKANNLQRVSETFRDIAMRLCDAASVLLRSGDQANRREVLCALRSVAAGTNEMIDRQIEDARKTLAKIG
ncbi:MAG: hypothetical protein ACLFV7_09665 [Phycisphaerae bacterium]